MAQTPKEYSDLIEVVLLNFLNNLFLRPCLYKLGHVNVSITSRPTLTIIEIVKILLKTSRPFAGSAYTLSIFLIAGTIFPVAFRIIIADL